MKNPENKTTAKASAGAKAKDAAASPAGRKPSATTPVIDSKPIEAASAAKAAATGGEIKPADSALVGATKTPGVAAAKKPEDKPTTLASPQQAKAGPADKTVDKTTDDKPAATPFDGKAAPAKIAPANTESANADAAKSDAAKVEPAKTEPAKVPDLTKPAVPGAAAPQKTGFWPVALGGVVAAGLGAAAALWVFPNGLQPAAAVDTVALKQEILSEAAAAAASEIAAQGEAAAQQAGEAGAEAARQIIAEMPAGADTTPELQAALEAQSQQIAALSEKLTALEGAAPAEGGGTVSPELQQRLAAMQAELEQAAAAAKTQIDSALAEAQKLQEAAQNSTIRAEAVAAVAALKSALEEGVSTDAAVQQLQDAGVAAPEAVQADPPTLLALQDSFAPAARAALRVALRDSAAESDGGTLIGNFLRAQTGARSVEPREGSDPDAILSRADAAVQSGDLAAALTELEALPAVARDAPEMAEWLAGAEAHVAARDALNELAGQPGAGQSN